MADQVIDRLRIIIGGEAGGLEGALDRASSKLTSFGSGVVKAAAAIGATMAASAVALGYAVGQSIDKIDNLGKAAQKAGAPIGEFSVLASAAGKAGIPLDELTASMEKLGRNVSAIAGGGKLTDAGRAFAALGIDVKDANRNVKSSSDIITELAGKFEQFRDGPEKTALAMAIFGKAGAEMIPLLNKGAQSLRDNAAEAERLGLVLDEKTVGGAEKFNRSLVSLGKVKDSIITKLTVGLLPALNDVTSAMVTTSKSTEAMSAISSTLNAIFKFCAEESIALAGAIKSIGVGIGGLIEAGKLLTSGEFSKAWEVMNAKFAESDAVMEATKQKLATLWSKPAADAVNYAAVIDQVEASMAALANVKLAAPIIANTAALDKFIDSTKKALAAQDAETRTVGMAAGAKEKLRVQLEANAIATAQHIPLTDALKSKVNDLGLAAEQSALKLAGTQLVFANKEPLTQYRTELSNTEAAMRAVGATADELARNQESVGAKFGMTWSAIGGNIASTAGALSQLTGTFAKENKAMGIASKAFGIAQAVINTQIAITKALASLPPPASYVAVGLAIASGAAAVASIAAQKFKAGGSFMVPGGIGGGDTVPFSAMLEPGERVDITPSHEVARGAGGNREITVRGFRPREFYTFDHLRDFVEELNDALGNGLKIKMAPT